MLRSYLPILLFLVLPFSFIQAQHAGHCDCLTLQNCPIPLIDNGMIQTGIPVQFPGDNDLAACPLEQVCFTITHSWVGDLSVSLEAPSGKKYLLMADVNNNYGGCGVEGDNLDICLEVGTDNPLTNNTEYVCNAGPCPLGVCCLTGNWTLPCNGVADFINDAHQAPNCDLNDFNVPGDPVNGNWILAVQDVCNQDIGILNNFSLSFACDDFIDSSTCQANGGYFYHPLLQVCEGDQALVIQEEPDFCPPVAPDSLFGYIFLITRNDTIVSLSPTVDLTTAVPGNYLIQGLSFELTALQMVLDFEGQLLGEVETLLSSDMAPFCGDFSVGGYAVQIDPDLNALDCQSIWVDAGPDLMIPCGGTDTLFGATSFGGASICSSFDWTYPSGEIISSNLSIVVSEAGQYLFNFYHQNGVCTKVDTVMVFNFSDHSAEILGPDSLYFCWEEEVELEGNVTGQGAFQYAWMKLGDFAILSNNTHFTVNEPGGYVFRVRNMINNCYDYDTVSIQYYSPLIQEVVSTISGCDLDDGTASVLLDSTASNVFVEWSNGETGTSISNLSPGWYSVSVSDAICHYEAAILVEEELSCKVVLKGHVYSDHINQDCIVDNTSYPVECIMLHLMPDDVYTYSQPDGSYEFVAYPGNHTIEYIDEDEYQLICPSDPVVSFDLPAGGMIAEGNDFFVKKESGQNLKISHTKGFARPGFNQSYHVQYRNLGTEPADAIVTFVHDPLLENVSLTAVADTYDPANQKATWVIPNVPPGVYETFHFTMYLPDDVPLGTLLNGYVRVDPVDIDDYPDNNYNSWTQEVTGSYDPNEKSTSTGANQWGGAITENDTTLAYQVLFQNTGTDTAFTVVIRDTLDEQLDVETIRPGMASHDYVLNFEDNNVLVFSFNDILLPDSNINEPASHGFVTFTIQRNKDLLPGVEIRNKGAIYFDFNAPIITNETVHFIPIPITAVEETITLCAGEAFEGIVYHDSDTLTDTIFAALGDTVFITNIHVVQPVETSVEASFCLGTVFEIAGQQFQDPGDYTLNLKTVEGCDSTVYLSLTGVQAVQEDLSAEICEGSTYLIFGDTLSMAGTYLFEKPGNGFDCDTIVQLELQLLANTEFSYTEEICEGDSLFFEGEWLTAAGVYTTQLSNVNGCDSLIALQINLLPELIIERDTAVVVGSEIFGHIIWSDTTLLENGLQENGCPYQIITSVSVYVSTDEIKNSAYLQVLPNPNNGSFTLKGALLESGIYELQLYNIYGQQVNDYGQRLRLDQHFEYLIEDPSLSQGVYYLVLKGTNHQSTVKLSVIR